MPVLRATIRLVVGGAVGQPLGHLLAQCRRPHRLAAAYDKCVELGRGSEINIGLHLQTCVAAARFGGEANGNDVVAAAAVTVVGRDMSLSKGFNRAAELGPGHFIENNETNGFGTHLQAILNSTMIEWLLWPDRPTCRMRASPLC